MYQVVASDLDGTLLAPDHTLSPYTKETLHRLTEQGVHFVFATGRHHVDVAQIRDNLGISAYMITANGARVHNTAGELILAHDIDPAIVTELAGFAADIPDVFTNIYRGDHWFINRHRPEEYDFFKESNFTYQIFSELSPTFAQQVSKFFFVSKDPQLLLTLEQKINARWENELNVSFSLPTCLEVMAGNVSKGEALAEVAGLLGYTLDDCIAFGDGMNDKEMLTMAGKGFIMDNAYPRLKETLPELEVIGSNAENAVAHVLRRLYPGND